MKMKLEMESMGPKQGSNKMCLFVSQTEIQKFSFFLKDRFPHKFGMLLVSFHQQFQ